MTGKVDIFIFFSILNFFPIPGFATSSEAIEMVPFYSSLSASESPFRQSQDFDDDSPLSVIEFPTYTFEEYEFEFQEVKEIQTQLKELFIEISVDPNDWIQILHWDNLEFYQKIRHYIRKSLYPKETKFEVLQKMNLFSDKISKFLYKYTDNFYYIEKSNQDVIILFAYTAENAEQYFQHKKRIRFIENLQILLSEATIYISDLELPREKRRNYSFVDFLMNVFQ